MTISRRHFLRAGTVSVLAGTGRPLSAQAVTDADTAKSWTKEDRPLPAVRVTSGRQHYFGYYDKQQSDPTGQYLLGLECNVIGRLQTPDDTATIGLVDLHRENHWTPIAETRAWNWQMGCHLEWLPGEGRRVIYKDKTEEYEIFGGGVIGSNGHALFSPDLKWLVTDRGGVNEQNERTLVIADVERRRCYDVGRYFSMPELTGPLRCDLHARWNRDGTGICFDSVHEGNRQMYLIDARPIVRA